MASEAHIESSASVALELRKADFESERQHLAGGADLSRFETRLIKWPIATQLAVICCLLRSP